MLILTGVTSYNMNAIMSTKKCSLVMFLHNIHIHGKNDNFIILLDSLTDDTAHSIARE